MKAFLVLVLAAAAASAGDARLDRPLPVPGTDDPLQYDDGTAYWISWEGLYRGVWFKTSGFYYDPWYGGSIMYMQYWFYHHSSYPWDTASFYADLYGGDAAAPVTLLNETSVTAVHYAPCNCVFSPWITTGDNFWGIANTSMSFGGWPSLLGDNSPNAFNHSFHSDDFMVWEPWIVQGSTSNDYFVRAEGIWGMGWNPGLSQSTWGSIKQLLLRSR
jgi:hypothetical protein